MSAPATNGKPTNGATLPAVRLPSFGKPLALGDVPTEQPQNETPERLPPATLPDPDPPEREPEPESEPEPAPEPTPDPPDPFTDTDAHPEQGPLPTPKPEPAPPSFAGTRYFQWVYWLVIAIGVTGQVLGFGELFGGQVQSYGAAIVVGAGFELVMVTFGDRALTMRAEQYRTRQWLPFMLISFVAAGVASGMNILHWWDFDHFHTLALIFGGVALLGYLGHIFDGFVRGTHYHDRLATWRYEQKLIADAEQRRRVEEEQRRVEEEKRRAETEEIRKKAAEARKKLPRPSKKGEQIKKNKAVAIGIALGVTDSKQLQAEISHLGWGLPTSKNTFKNWLDEISKALAADGGTR